MELLFIVNNEKIWSFLKNLEGLSRILGYLKLDAQLSSMWHIAESLHIYNTITGTYIIIQE
jgi:hypothetical protein